MEKRASVLDGVDMDKLLRFLREIDGHDIVRPAMFTDMGFDEGFVAQFLEKHRSNKSHHKETIFRPDGSVADSLQGVHDLAFVRGLATEVGADMTIGNMMSGRGSEARAHAKAIMDKLGLCIA